MTKKPSPIVHSEQQQQPQHQQIEKIRINLNKLQPESLGSLSFSSLPSIHSRSSFQLQSKMHHHLNHVR